MARQARDPLCADAKPLRHQRMRQFVQHDRAENSEDKDNARDYRGSCSLRLVRDRGHPPEQKDQSFVPMAAHG